VTDNQPTTTLPTDEFETEDERTTLLAFLDYQRRVLAARLGASPTSRLASPHARRVT